MMKNFILGFIYLNLLPMQLNAENNSAENNWYVVEYSQVNQYRILNGEVEAINKSTVSAQTSGRIETINYDVDDWVEQHAILVELTNTEQTAQLKQAQENAKAAQIAYQQAETDYNRVKDIYAKKLVAQSQLDQALSNRNALKAKFSAAQSAVMAAQEQLSYTTIKAPYAGIVTQRFVELGETVNTGTPIMQGLSLNHLRVLTHIPESVINPIKTHPVASIILPHLTEIKATDITIFPYAEPTSRSFKTRLSFATDSVQLMPGMSVKVRFTLAAKQAILIPKSAVVTTHELHTVYVLEDKHRLPRQVKLGSEQDDFIEVIAGLNADEKIILSPLN